MLNEGRRNALHAFTLIELLTVTAVIVVVAALLLPVAGRITSHARSLYCLSQVRQWNLAIWSHGTETGGYYPYEGHFMRPIDVGPNRDAWYNRVTEYLNHPSLADLYVADDIPLPGNPSLFTCPEATRQLSRRPSRARPYFMYGFNNRMDPNGPGRFRLQQVALPDQTVVFTENTEDRHPATGGYRTPARHRNRASLGFADGHAALVSTNDYARTLGEDRRSRVEWARTRSVYWYPFSGASR